MKRFIVLGNIQNISEDGKVNTQIASAQLKANNHEEAVGKFTSLVFDNLKNPKDSLVGKPVSIEIDDSQFKRIIKKLWNKRK
jgi:hypothetical protein